MAGTLRAERWRLLSSPRNADVAQLVEHHLAKVRVAGSNPVVRSEPRALVERLAPACGGVAERRGNGLQSRLHGFKSRLHLVSSRNTSAEEGPVARPGRAIGAAVARFPDTEEVTGSIPVSPTDRPPGGHHGGLGFFRSRRPSAGTDPPPPGPLPQGQYSQGQCSQGQCSQDEDGSSRGLAGRQRVSRRRTDLHQTRPIMICNAATVAKSP